MEDSARSLHNFLPVSIPAAVAAVSRSDRRSSMQRTESLLAALLVEQFVFGHNHVSSRLRSGAISRVVPNMT